MFITRLGHYPIVLGIPWLRHHDVAVRFASNLVTFDSDYCLEHCTEHTTTVRGLDQEPLSPHETESQPLDASLTHLHIGDHPLTFESHSVQDLDALEDVELCRVVTDKVEPPPRITLVGASAFLRMAKKERLQIFSLSLYDINRALDPKTIEEGRLEELIPEEYHEFLPLFQEVAARELPPHRTHDHTIPLKEGFEPPFGPIYSLSRVELETLKAWLEDNLNKG